MCYTDLYIVVVFIRWHRGSSSVSRKYVNAFFFYFLITAKKNHIFFMWIVNISTSFSILRRSTKIINYRPKKKIK